MEETNGYQRESAGGRDLDDLIFQGESWLASDR